MAEAFAEVTTKDDLGESSPRKMRPPDKKKFDEELGTLNKAIHAREAELKSLNLRPEEVYRRDVAAIYREKEATLARRKKINNDLRELNQESIKKRGSLEKLQSTLPYRDESRINGAIRRLEDQLKQHNFKLSEEKKIVAEIDRMKRSKKALMQYDILKREHDEMRDRQRRAREEREHYSRAITSLTNREIELKQKNHEAKSKADEFKKELGELNKEKRHLVGEYQRQEREFNEFRGELRRKHREEKNQRREEERQAQIEQHQKDMEEYMASLEPYQKERQSCSTLIAYLQRYLATDETEAPSDQSQERNAQQDSAKDLETKGIYLLKKKTDDELYGGLSRAKPNKRSKRDKRRTSNKSIVHSPQVFGEFESLQLKAPLTVSEVTQSLEQLHAKKHYFEDLIASSNPSIQIDGSPTDNASDESAGAPSVTESAITESMPSTPEVQMDNTPPCFTGSLGLNEIPPRRLSRDSGACELEEGNSCDEQGDSVEKPFSFCTDLDSMYGGVRPLLESHITSNEASLHSGGDTYGEQGHYTVSGTSGSHIDQEQPSQGEKSCDILLSDSTGCVGDTISLQNLTLEDVVMPGASWEDNASSSSSEPTVISKSELTVNPAELGGVPETSSFLGNFPTMPRPDSL